MSFVPPSTHDEVGFELPRGVALLFAAAAGLSVANVYYAQPLLPALAREFGIGEGAVGGVVTATQAGCALALLLIVPLGDRVDRRRLMGAQLLALVLALTAVALAHSTVLLLAGMLAVGLAGTAMTQGLIAYAASASPAHARGGVVGTAQAGVFLGLLLARVFAGGVGDLLGWRGVYACSAALLLVLALPLWRRLPVLPTPKRVGYRHLLASLASLLRRDRTLRTRGLLGALMFATFNVFWNALGLALHDPPYEFTQAGVGVFGLAGAAGALAAAHAGRWVDRGYGQHASALGLVLLALSWWPLSAMPRSLPMLVVGIVLLDFGSQALHVTNQALILRVRPELTGRLLSLYMLFYAVGSGLGGIAATATYSRFQWPGVCVLGAGLSLMALGAWVADQARVRRAG